MEQKNRRAIEQKQNRAFALLRYCSSVEAMLENTAITYQTFVFSIIADDAMSLPSYKGSTLRGGFGHAFKRVVCTLKLKDCKDCLLKNKCIYSYVFETPPPPDAKIMRKYAAAPHPFVIEPPQEKRRGYKPGDEMHFGLVLIGRAVDYLPYFIYTFQEFGKIGIGKGKGSFKLQQVSSDGQTVYDSESKVVMPFKTCSLSLESGDLISTGDEQLTLLFSTPTRIFYNNRLTIDLEFHILIRNLLRRLSLLYYFHCSGNISAWDFKGAIENAKKVRTVSSNLRWRDWQRYSARQDTCMKMGGFIGEITFEGNIKPFMSLIKAGEILHAGKGTSFGLGKYEIK